MSAEQRTEKGAPPCDVCGKPSTTSDGICGAELCDDTACLDVTWSRAFSPEGSER